MSGTDKISRRSLLREVRVLVVFAFIVSFLVADIALAAEQQVLFCGESIRYANDTEKSKCESKCEKYGDCKLDSLLSDGWLIVTSSSKEIIGIDWVTRPRNEGYLYPGSFGCSCVGTQYVLRKEDKSTIANSKISGKEADLLKKENELLKRENAILKQENEKLRGKLKTKQKSKTNE